MQELLAPFQDIGGAEVRGVFNQILVLVWDPTANLTAALLLYGIIALLLLILVFAVILFLLGADEEEGAGDSREGRAGAPVTSPQAEGTDARERPRSRLVWVTIVAVLLTVAWLGTGYATSHPSVCTGCHVITPHGVETAATDPHAGTSCVSCHEGGGTAGRYVSRVPFRALHFFDGVVDVGLQAEYGRVTRSACFGCHEGQVGSPTLSEARGLRMSHAEPLEAGAVCLDCHRIQDGVVSVHNAGMNPCLQCHDSKQASSECVTCHDGQATAAARVRTADFASVQVEEVRCGGCHDEQQYCDPCHGVRMPHEREFMMYAHARAAVVDIWYSGGSTCVGECHTESRRPCGRCHGQLLGRGHGPSLAGWHRNSYHENCDRCHQQWAFSPQRDFCEDVCHTEAAMRYSPR